MLACTSEQLHVLSGHALPPESNERQQCEIMGINSKQATEEMAKEPEEKTLLHESVETGLPTKGHRRPVRKHPKHL